MVREHGSVSILIDLTDPMDYASLVLLLYIVRIFRIRPGSVNIKIGLIMARDFVNHAGQKIRFSKKQRTSAS